MAGAPSRGSQRESAAPSNCPKTYKVPESPRMVTAFIVIPVLLAIALVWSTAVAWRRSGAPPAATTRVAIVTALVTAAWMGATWAAAESGVLRLWDQRPPPFGVLVVAIIVLAVALAFSTLGRYLAQFIPLWTLVAVQSFRLPLELAMHDLSVRGIMPQQMTYTGRNFDIVTGITAIIVAAAAARGRGGQRLVAIWNVLGLALLVNVVTIAMLSTPVFRYFGNERLNVFVAEPPFVWLPAVMVFAALAGHLIIFRALLLPR
jgi:hypothetical protein